MNTANTIGPSGRRPSSYPHSTHASDDCIFVLPNLDRELERPPQGAPTPQPEENAVDNLANHAYLDVTPKWSVSTKFFFSSMALYRLVHCKAKNRATASEITIDLSELSEFGDALGALGEPPDHLRALVERFADHPSAFFRLDYSKGVVRLVFDRPFMAAVQRPARWRTLWCEATYYFRRLFPGKWSRRMQRA